MSKKTTDKETSSQIPVEQQSFASSPCYGLTIDELKVIADMTVNITKILTDKKVSDLLLNRLVSDMVGDMLHNISSINAKPITHIDVVRFLRDEATRDMPDRYRDPNKIIQLLRETADYIQDIYS
jgi:hypothetical protein